MRVRETSAQVAKRVPLANPATAEDMLAMIRLARPGTRKLEFTLPPDAVSEVHKAMATFEPAAPTEVNPLANLVKLSLDVGVQDHLFHSDFKASLDLLSLVNKPVTEASGQLARPGVSMRQKRIEGAVAGASLSAVLLAFKTTRDAISNPALGALGLIALGATVWPAISKMTFTLKPDGSVSTRIDFKLA